MTRRLAILLAAMALVITGCTAGAPILAAPTAARPSIAATTAPPAAVADPVPIRLPYDDAPHDRLTEWWYYTGHLRDEAGQRYGFEYVVFRAERGAFPTSWASHLALTDETGGRFHYAQRSEIGPQVDVGIDASPAVPGFAFALRGDPPGTPWQMTGSDGHDRLVAIATASEDAAEVGFGLELALDTDIPAALHGTDGWIDFGAAGGSYYYSRTRMAVAGVLRLDDRALRVEGTGWFDHQWGDFIAIGGGGWDWFAVNLGDGTDVTLSLVRDADGSPALVYGTLVDLDGHTRHLDRSSFSVEVTGRWRSPSTGADYPAAWRISIPDEELVIELTPTVAHQELDTRPTTGVVYWEGSQTVRASRDGEPLGGEAYVELTGYAPSTIARP